MNDPTLVTQIITTGTASVSVIGSDGSGKSKVLTAAEVRTAAETISETAINTALSGKQATLVSATNIKTVNSTSLLGSGDIVISSGTLTTVTITDAAVAMVANRRYQGSIAAFTADRNYTLPAGTAGDVIEVQITTGDDLYELILLGATGVSINGGSTATEWSRVYADNEFVRFECFATNNWRVVIDGRLEQAIGLSSATTQSVSRDTVTKISLATYSSGNQSLHDSANGRIKLRRACGVVATAYGARNFMTGTVDTATFAVSTARLHNASGLIAGSINHRYTKPIGSDFLEYSCSLPVSPVQAVDAYVEMHVFFSDSASSSSNVNIGATMVFREVLL